MKKIILALGLILAAALPVSAQNTTQVKPTNGIENATANFTGIVKPRLFTNDFNPASTNEFYGWDGTRYGWFPAGGGGSATPGGVDGNVQYNNAGALSGTNIWSVVFVSGNPRFTNSVGTGYEWADSGLGLWSQTGNGTGLIRNQFYRRQDGFGVDEIYNGHTDNKYYLGNRQGVSVFYGASAVSLAIGSNPSGVMPDTYLSATNSRVLFQKNADGGTNLMTNFANLYNRHAQIDHSASVVDTGNAVSFFVNAATWKCGGWAQDAPASNDTFHSWVNLEAGIYNFYTFGVTDNNRGQQRWSLINVGGTTTSTWSMDWYNVVAGVNTRKTQTVVVPVDGRYKISSTVTNKNASSSSFYIFIQEYGFQQ